MSGAPRQLGNDTVLVDASTAKRVRALVARIGVKDAKDRLRVSTYTLEQARGGGRVQRETRDRLVVALNREEAIAS